MLNTQCQITVDNIGEPCTRPVRPGRKFCRACGERTHTAMMRTLRRYGDGDLADKLEPIYERSRAHLDGYERHCRGLDLVHGRIAPDREGDRDLARAALESLRGSAIGAGRNTWQQAAADYATARESFKRIFPLGS